MHITPVPLLVVFALMSPAPAPASRRAADEDELRRAVNTLGEKPLSKEGGEAAGTIAAFGDESDVVVIKVTETVVPWLTEEGTPHSELLLAAFIGGDALGQLDAGVKADDPWSGMLQVFRVYRAMKAVEPKLKVPSIDRLLDEHRRGELAARLLGPAPKVLPKSGTRPKAGSKPAAAAASDAPETGLVPNAATAIRIAVAVWEPIYGADAIADEKPYRAALADGVWTVTGSLPEGMLGGVAEADIAQADGHVLRVTHGE